MPQCPNFDTALLYKNTSSWKQWDTPGNKSFFWDTTQDQEKPYNLTLWVNDTANTNSKSFFITVDNTKPTIHITEPEYANISRREYNITWSGSDDTCLATISYRLDGGSWANTTKQYHDFNSLSTGTHTLELVIFDKANNTASDTYHFTVDVTDPTVSFIEEWNGKIYNSKSFKVNWLGSDNATGIKNYSIKVESEAWVNQTRENRTIKVPNEGNYTIRLRGYDWAGHSREVSVWLWVDTQTPQLLITSNQNGKNISSSQVNITWSGNDSHGISNYSYRVKSIPLREFVAKRGVLTLLSKESVKEGRMKRKNDEKQSG